MTTAAKELKPFCVEVFALWYHEDHSSDRHFSRTYTIYTLCLVFGGIFYAQTILCSSLTALSNNFIHSWYARCFITMCNKRDFLFKHTRDILTIIHRSYALITVLHKMLETCTHYFHLLLYSQCNTKILVFHIEQVIDSTLCRVYLFYALNCLHITVFILYMSRICGHIW